MNPPNFETLELQFEGQLAMVRLDRPVKANSMDASLWAEL